MLITHWWIVIYFLISISQRYPDVPLVWYLAFFFGSWVFTLTILLNAKQIKEILLLIKENRDLVHTIETILKAFPEGVIIRSLDQTCQKVISKFSNNVYEEHIWKENQDILICRKDEDAEDQNVTLEDFLWMQEDEIIHNHDGVNKIAEQIIEIKKRVRHLENDNSTFEEDVGVSSFNVKTIKVTWEKNCQSFMHVFVETTSIRKLEKVKAVNKWQQIMFASVSHEFRTPLNAFMNSLQIVELTVEDIKRKLRNCPEIEDKVEPSYPRLDKMIKIGNISSKLLLNLVEDILDLAKFNAGKFELNLSEFKVKEVLQEIDYIFAFQCQEKHLEFKIEVNPLILENTFCSDSRRIKQILINLISNSLKFTQRGGITIKVNSIFKRGCNYLRFEVIDSGIGIAHEDLKNLFQIFGMIEKWRLTLNQNGTGIGLSISKKLVESLGGEIKAESEEGRWTSFTFYILNNITQRNNELGVSITESYQGKYSEKIFSLQLYKNILIASFLVSLLETIGNCLRTFVMYFYYVRIVWIK